MPKTQLLDASRLEILLLPLDVGEDAGLEGGEVHGFGDEGLGAVDGAQVEEARGA